MGHLLIVDDEPAARTTLSALLRRHGHEVHEAASGEEARELLGQGVFDLVLTDLRLPGMDGVGVLQSARESDPHVEVIIVTAFGTVASAVDAMKLGAFDYFEKPFDPEALVLAVDKALERRSLRREVNHLRSALAEEQSFAEIVVRDAGMLRVLEQARRVAPTDAAVLIEGETGSGKELLARAIHGASRRARSRLVTLNCAALPEALLESELFGHVKGAFTGATATKPGLFEAADRGTLFLDEIGDMALATQTKLLRALQDGEVRRVGSTEPLHVNVRLIAATNQDLEEKIAASEFREDLYYRLHVVKLEIPPLRERADDIMPLAWHFVARFAGRYGKRPEDIIITPEGRQALLDHPWPGNVRELENLIERALLLAEGTALGPEELGIGERPRLAAHSGSERLAEVEREHILSVLERHEGNRSAAARALGIGRNTLWRRLNEYGINE